MKSFSLAIFCIVFSVAAASWNGGVALVAPTAYGGAVVGGHAPGAVIVGPGGYGAWNGWAGGHGLAGHGLWAGGWNGANGLWNVASGAWAGSGHEGQWVPDHNEKLYDDGSYKPEYH